LDPTLVWNGHFWCICVYSFEIVTLARAFNLFGCAKKMVVERIRFWVWRDDYQLFDYEKAFFLAGLVWNRGHVYHELKLKSLTLLNEKKCNNCFNLTIPVVMKIAVVASLLWTIFTPSPSGRNCRLSKCYDQPAAERNNVKSYLKSFGVYLFQWIKKNYQKIFELLISVIEYDFSIGDNTNYNFWVNNVWH